MKKILFAITGAMLSSSMALASLEEDIQFVNDFFAGNGSGSSIRTYDPAKLKIEELAKAMYADRADSGCYSPEIKVIEPEYFAQRDLTRHAIDITKQYISDVRTWNSHSKEEVDRLSTVLRGVLKDKSNKLIVSSEFNHSNPDDSEGCMVYLYEIYRADGKLIKIEFNETD